MKYVGLDTSVLSHYFKPSQQEDIENYKLSLEANQIIEYMKKNECIVVMPVVVMYEFECDQNDDDAYLFHQAFIKQFNVTSFCSDSAYHASRIFNKAVHPFNKDTWASRSKSLVKADCMILATMLKIGIYNFFTFDSDYFKIKDRSGDLLSKMNIMKEVPHAQMEVPVS